MSSHFMLCLACSLNHSTFNFTHHTPTCKSSTAYLQHLISLLAPLAIDASHLPIFPSSAVPGPSTYASSPHREVFARVRVNLANPSPFSRPFSVCHYLPRAQMLKTALLFRRIKSTFLVGLDRAES